jgi:hypothetical protein
MRRRTQYCSLETVRQCRVPSPVPHAQHVAAFYQSDDFLTERIASFVAEGLARDERVIVVATMTHWNAVAARLENAGVSHGRAATDRRLILLDAEHMLDAITVDGRVMGERLAEMLTPLLSTRTRIYGELVSLLAQRGDLESALGIETLGHDLSRMLKIDVLCGYQSTSTSPLAPADVRRIHDAHDGAVFEDAVNAADPTSTVPYASSPHQAGSSTIKERSATPSTSGA